MLRSLALGLLVVLLPACTGGPASDVLIADASDLATDIATDTPGDGPACTPPSVQGCPCDDAGASYCPTGSTSDGYLCFGGYWTLFTDVCGSWWSDAGLTDTAPPAYCADAGEPLPGCACSVP
ncbi:MAG: hypothetical protein WCJ30_16460, partial [Deltaproteobacteria bacterium]